MAFNLTLASSLQDCIRQVLALLRGESNNVGSFTLAAGATSTTVSFPNSAPGKTVQITPCTANAAAALATTYIPPATVAQGAFVVNHANNGQLDRTFFFEITGGG